MIWKSCVLKNKVEGSADALGNKTITWSTVKTTEARLTPFDNSKIGLDRRQVTSDQQYFVLKDSSIPQCEKAVIGNITYDIVQVIKLEPRYIVLGCKVYKA